MLNVNEPETRGIALALQTMLDDLGKGGWWVAGGCSHMRVIMMRWGVNYDGLVCSINWSGGAGADRTSTSSVLLSERWRSRPCRPALIRRDQSHCIMPWPPMPAIPAGMGPALVAVLISHLGRTAAFNYSAAGWIPCGLLLLATGEPRLAGGGCME